MSKTIKILTFIPVLILFLFTCVSLAYAEGNKAGIVTGDSLNVRESPNLAAKVLAQFSKGAKVKVIGYSDDWYNVSYNDVAGWVYSEFLSVRDESIGTGTINGEDVNVRSAPNLTAEVITRFDKGAKVEVFERSADWYRIGISDDKYGWVFSKYILIRESIASRGIVDDTVPDTGSPAVETPDNSQEAQTTQQKLIQYAKKYLGVKYVYGGASPKGFDCSGFVKYVYEHFSINLERTAEDQSKHGIRVKRENLQIGDLVFFDTNGGNNAIEHVGIYIGSGKFIHSSSGRTKHKVVISDMSDGFYNDCYMTARRYAK